MSKQNPQKANFEAGFEPGSIGRITKKTVRFDDLEVTKVRFPVGVSVTQEGKTSGVLDGGSCPLPHTGYILSGTLGIKQDNGFEETYRAGDVMLLPPGHEAWTIGEEDCVFIEFSKGHADFYV
ncbi:MAG TPA: hypothetical protein VLZ31_07125 [Microbacteriaceae bacterium]|nr:hypothetical protein [Microbacteriaceae bacterium]